MDRERGVVVYLRGFNEGVQTPDLDSFLGGGGESQFSVYNPEFQLSSHALHPLARLLPSSFEEGWHVSRNLLKPLNHLAMLREKEVTAKKLGLHNLAQRGVGFEQMYLMLEAHQQGQISTAEAIEYISERLGSMSSSEVRLLLEDYATVTHMEFHPTDVCNLSCTGCTYGHDDPATKPPPTRFPFQAIETVARLKPRSIVIIGGGEPTLYRHSGHAFDELITSLRRQLPDVNLALTTNGTHKPSGLWPNQLSWLRVSLDAATEGTYASFRGRPMFEQVMENYLSYLDYDIEYVGLSFLFSRINVHEYADIAKMVHELVSERKPAALPKVNIQYRPLRRDPYHYDRVFDLGVTQSQIDATVAELNSLADTSPEMERFLREQTNATAILGGNSHPPHEFSRCYYSQVFRIVRASGDLRPCFIRVEEPDFRLGNIVTDELATIALNAIYVGCAQKPHCTPEGCRQCHVNHVFERGLAETLLPSTAPEVHADPMF